MHVVVLDFNVYYMDDDAPYRQPQLEWLEKDLAIAASPSQREKVPWILVVSHYPMYCSSNSMGAMHNDGQGGDDEPAAYEGCWSYGSNINILRNDVEPLFQKYSVDLYSAGHEHDLEIIYPVTNGTLVQKSFDKPSAPVHIVTGAGGAPALDTFGDAGPWTMLQRRKWGYGIVSTQNASMLTYTHVDNADDNVFIEIHITK